MVFWTSTKHHVRHASFKPSSSDFCVDGIAGDRAKRTDTTPYLFSTHRRLLVHGSSSRYARQLSANDRSGLKHNMREVGVRSQIQ